MDFVLITTQSATRGTGHGVACADNILLALVFARIKASLSRATVI